MREKKTFSIAGPEFHEFLVIVYRKAFAALYKDRELTLPSLVYLIDQQIGLTEANPDYPPQQMLDSLVQTLSYAIGEPEKEPPNAA